MNRCFAKLTWELEGFATTFFRRRDRKTSIIPCTAMKTWLSFGTVIPHTSKTPITVFKTSTDASPKSMSVVCSQDPFSTCCCLFLSLEAARNVFLSWLPAFLYSFSSPSYSCSACSTIKIGTGLKLCCRTLRFSGNMPREKCSIKGVFTNTGSDIGFNTPNTSLLVCHLREVHSWLVALLLVLIQGL